MPRSSDQPPGRRREYRFGPVVFVPEFGSSADDPWAHRKGEPRLFTLLWAIYLLIAAMGTIFATRTIGPPTPTSYRIGCLSMLSVVAIGGVVLWPAVRLSQRSPEHPFRAVGADLAVILLPTQTVVWPMPLLTHWPWDTTAAMALSLTAWVLAIGGVVARTVRRGPGAARGLVMLGICVAAFAGPALGLLGAARGMWSPRPGLLASPLTASWALAETPANLAPVMTPIEWWAVLAPALAAAVIWVGALHRPRPAAA